MNSFKIFCSLLFILVSASFVSAQTGAKSSNVLSVANSSALKSSPAFAEVILRKTELLSDLEALLIDYQEEFPKVKELRFEIDALDKSIQRLAAVKPNESSKLTPALGKLLVRKAELETDLWNLRNKYGDNHPEVKRAKRKVEIYENAIKEIF